MKNTILSKAKAIVEDRSEEKDRQYGDFEESMKKTAAIATLISGKEISETDVYHVMIALKLAREANKHKEDNLLDAVAYIAVLNEVQNKKSQ